MIDKRELLDLLPQKKPFLFVDEILEVNDKKIVGKYRFRPDEFYYQGHFPNNPITPGVILLESMTQVGLVALGMYLISLNEPKDAPSNFLCFFSDGIVEFLKPVFPDEEVTIYAEKIFWRQKKLKSKVEMYRGDTLVASSIVSGMQVEQ